MEHYVYRLLQGPRSFRVFHILQTWQDGPVTGELKEYNLDECPKYQALSYAWEGTMRECPIYCDGKVLFVTKSCEGALRRLIYGKSSRLIWVDAICINQQDTQERNQQVSMMGDIYRKAEHVNVWLGPGTAATDAALTELMSLFKAAALARTRGPFPQWRKNRFKQQIADLQARDEQRYDLHPFGLFGEIFTRTWFGRMWIVQEIVMAQSDKVMLYCGQKMMRFEILDIAVDFSDVSGLSPSQHHWRSYTAPLRMLKGAVKAKAQGRPLHPNATFTKLLILTAFKKSTIPVDKIFGLHAIAKHLGWHLPPPDYNKPTCQVFTEATKFAIQTDQSLQILIFAGRPTSIEGLPSWAADFAQLPIGTFLMNANCAASRGSSPFCWFDATGRKFTLMGRMIDVLRICGRSLYWDIQQTIFNNAVPPLAQFDAAANTIQQWMNILQLYQQQQGSYPNGETIDQAFARTLLTDIIQATDPGPADAIRVCSILRTHLQSPDAPQNTPGPELRYAMERVLTSSTGKSFAVTEARRFAMVPAAARVDDVVVIFAGSVTPSILRQQEEEFLFVGSAYIHGVMDGECWTDDQTDVQEFTLV